MSGGEKMDLGRNFSGAAVNGGGSPSLSSSVSEAESESQVHAQMHASVVQNLDDVEAEVDKQIERLKQNGKEEEANDKGKYYTRKTRVQNMLELVTKANKERPKTLWNGMFVEGTLCDLFGKTGVNKSTVAFQLLFEYAADHPTVNMAYCNLEMSERSQALRFYDLDKQQIAQVVEQHGSHIYSFSIGRDFADLPAKLQEIERLANEYEFEIIIIDPLTLLDPMIERGENAQQLMDMLKDMHERLNLKRTTTMINISHTPKRDSSLPIDQDSMGGSKRLANTFDEMVAINTSVKGDNIRYFKQVKCRDMEITYGERNVLVGTIEKVDGMLQFVTDGHTEPESVHLVSSARQVEPQKVLAVQQQYATLIAQQQQGRDACVKKVAQNNGISPTTVRKYLSDYDHTNGYLLPQQERTKNKGKNGIR